MKKNKNKYFILLWVVVLILSVIGFIKYDNNMFDYGDGFYNSKFKDAVWNNS